MQSIADWRISYDLSGDFKKCRYGFKPQTQTEFKTFFEPAILQVRVEILMKKMFCSPSVIAGNTNILHKKNMNIPDPVNQIDTVNSLKDATDIL